MNSVNRYADVAERELKEGAVRQPVWNEVMAEAGGEPEIARELYQHRRVSENLEIEKRYSVATQALRKLRDFNDSLAPSFPIKIALFGLGIILMLVLAFLVLNR